MQLRTNLQKWNHYNDILVSKANDFMDTITPEIPSMFWLVTQGGGVKECTILERNYNYGYYVMKTDKPTRNEVAIVKKCLDELTEFSMDKAYYGYCYYAGYFKATTSIKIKNLFTNGNTFRTREEAETKAKEVIDKVDERKRFNEEHKKDASYNYNQNGYRFLGWQNGWRHVYFDADGNQTDDRSKQKTFGYLTSDYPEYGTCLELGHRRIEVSHNQRGSENTVSCPICKIYWKYDSSD